MNNLSPFQLWFSVLAAVLHLILSSLTTDGGASILARYGIDARLSVKALPVTILVCSIGAGVVDNVVDGVDVQHAFATAFMVAIASLGGTVGHHALVSSGSSMCALLGAGLLIALAACTPAEIRKAETVVSDSATCLVSKQDLPDATAFAECGVQEAEQLLAAQRLHAMRAETARAAHVAAHAAQLGCSHGGAQ